MPVFDPCSLARWTAGRWTEKPVVPVTGFAIDTRQLQAGDVFVALRTERRDGHEFLGAAAAGGAAAALVERADPALALPQLVVAEPLRAFQAIAREHRLAFPGRVIGITGSAGKTSTKALLARLLGSDALATEGNLNNHLGVPLTLTRLDPVQHRFAVIEAGISEPGEMAVLAGMIEPDVAIVTLVAPAHTQALGGLDGVAREKAVLSAAVRPGGVAILPRSVAEHAPFQTTGVRRLVIERAPDAPWTGRADDRVPFAVQHRADATLLMILGENGVELPFSLPPVSDGMAQNAVLAVAAALWLGLEPARLQERLASWTPPALRGEVRHLEGRLVYLDCYNANPASMRDALASFERQAEASAPRWYVLGGMEELGEESARHHRELGQTLRLRPGDRLSVIGGEAEQVREGALEAGAQPGQVEVVTSVAPLAARLAGFHGAIFVKGSRKYRLEEILVGTPAAPATLGAH